MYLFFDNHIWFSKKYLDYRDWKIILLIKNEGKHLTEEGNEIFTLISKIINRNRLSTNFDNNDIENIEEIISKLLTSPSNYEIQPDGKILIKSSGNYLKGRGNIGVNVFDGSHKLINSFSSIKECALYYGVS